MKSEKMLERCLELAVYLSEDDAISYNYFLSHKDDCGAAFGVGGLLAALIHDLEDDIKAEGAKASGRSNALSAARRIIEQAKSKSNRSVHGAWMSKDKQCMCDGYRGVRLVKPLEVDPLPDVLLPLDLDRIVDDAIKNKGSEIQLPTIGALKAHIKVEKARKKVKKDRAPVEYDFGADLMLVNAEYLLDMMALLPGCKAYAAHGRPGLGPVYFESEAGDGVLLPVRRRDRKAA